MGTKYSEILSQNTIIMWILCSSQWAFHCIFLLTDIFRTWFGDRWHFDYSFQTGVCGSLSSVCTQPPPPGVSTRPACTSSSLPLQITDMNGGLAWEWLEHGAGRVPLPPKLPLISPRYCSIHLSYLSTWASVSVYKVDVLPPWNCFLPFKFHHTFSPEYFTPVTKI